MSKKTGRNDPCPCGSGKKYKNCCMKKEQENGAAKYTPTGKRKFKAKVLSVKDKSLSVFSRSATVQASPPSPDTLQKLKFRLTKSDFRKKEEKKEEPLPFQIPSPEEEKEKPEERERHLPKPGEAFKPTKEDFRKKEEK